MPLYDFACSTCEHHFSRRQSISAEHPPCPECGGGVRKLVSAPAFHLKGGGWYSDHYGLKKSTGASGGEAPSPSSSGGEAK